MTLRVSTDPFRFSSLIPPRAFTPIGGIAALLIAACGGSDNSAPKTAASAGSSSGGSASGGSGANVSGAGGTGGTAPSGGTSAGGTKPSGGGESPSGGSGNQGGALPVDKGVRVLPGAVTMLPGAVQAFTCVVEGDTSVPCKWSVQEADGGSITPEGSYTAPAKQGTYHVVATSSQDPNKVGYGTVILPPEGGGTPGVWHEVTMPVKFTYAMSLVSDPIRPQDYYGFVTDGAGADIHVLKSTDYGETWAVASHGQMMGDPWGAAIDPSLTRDPQKPPTMYTPAGYGSNGLWKSTDGGVTFKQMFPSSPAAPWAEVATIWPPDLYSVTILPDGVDHILVTYHGGFKNSEDGGLGESTDGGKTWTIHKPAAGMGGSQYLLVIDQQTWLAVAQDNGGRSGVWRTATAGLVDGKPSPAAWKQVDVAEHVHGSFTGTVVDGVPYVPCGQGIRRSKDKGLTWEWAFMGRTSMSWVVTTEKYLYADWLMGPNLVRSGIADGGTWESYTQAPSNMAGGLGPGTQTVASSSDGKRWFIVNFNNDGGVWRYIE